MATAVGGTWQRLAAERQRTANVLARICMALFVATGALAAVSISATSQQSLMCERLREAYREGSANPDHALLTREIVETYCR